MANEFDLAGLASTTDPEVRRQILDSPAYHAWREKYRAESRLSIPAGQRITLATLLSFASGTFLGVSHGAQTAGLRFRAENAHRLPSSQTGWYLYHKSKNYQVALGGMKEGVKMGVKVGGWVAAFFLIENGWDECRGEKDFINTTMASLTVAGGFSIWNRFPVQTAARTAKTGLAIGLAFGLAQDAVGILRGRTPAYVGFLKRGGQRKGAEETVTDLA